MGDDGSFTRYCDSLGMDGVSVIEEKNASLGEMISSLNERRKCRPPKVSH
jgi:hypothetical protein